ncbi:MFS general substrate transporter [Mycena rosella]|uniref:MFS general substrate transporter n=1 Tax=Mycena rosella TaxID=1033263 RepID=A0AAD7MCS0_MYCRO|nr:MFS general substrate transporter [Mycena rosella]
MGSDSGNEKQASIGAEKDVTQEGDNQNHAAVEVSVKEVDTAVALVFGEHGELDPEEALRVRYNWYVYRTIYRHTAIQPQTRLGTIFYLSYLAFEFPQNLALQRFPVAKWMSVNIFVWAIALSSHAACKNFGGLFVVRLILGMCEGFLIVSSMFYTRTEQTLRIGYWFLMNGTAQIISGFISFGTLHIKMKSFEPWQWLMIITGILTLITSVSFWFFFPDSPTNACENQTGVENKHFKKEQMVEALLDPKTWLFAIFAALDMIPNRDQRSIIITTFGFTTLQTTLLGCVDGVVEILTIYIGVTISARTGSRAWVAFFWIPPNVLGSILISVLPWHNKIGLLFSIWLTVIGLSWVSAVTAGHTKRVTTNAIMLGAYCIGNGVGPFMWQAKYKPRNRVPWIIIASCYVCSMGLVLVIRHLLIAENKRRDAENKPEAGYDDVYIERLAQDGSGVMEKVKIDKEFLDLTDIQNRDFRYVY